jgi:D-arabinose 1-dehydrogenase-like Zn-dependent alcohol dehydrogenase
MKLPIGTCFMRGAALGAGLRYGCDIAIERLSDPSPGSDEVVIDVKASGICHTNIEILRGNYGSSSFPFVQGHEFAGEVVAGGSRRRRSEHRRCTCFVCRQ